VLLGGERPKNFPRREGRTEEGGGLRNIIRIKFSNFIKFLHPQNALRGILS
jgi:hypothetical protein